MNRPGHGGECNEHAAFIAMFIFFLSVVTTFAQGPHIQYMLPDAGAPGMCVQLDFIAHRDSIAAFGPDGVASGAVQILTLNPDDTDRVRFGPIVVRYFGRLVHTVVSINPNAKLGPVPVRIRRGSKIGNVDTFFIKAPDHIGVITGGYATLGDGTPRHGRRTRRGTIIADSIILVNGTYKFSTADVDPAIPGNQGLLPVSVLLTGRFSLDNLSNLRLDANGADGGPGGGGGQGNVVLTSCATPPVVTAPGNGYSGGTTWSTGTPGIGTAAGGASLSGTTGVESGGPAFPFDGSTNGGAGGMGQVDTGHISGGGGGGSNALSGGNANSGVVANGGRAIGSPDIVPLCGGGGGGGGAAFGTQCPVSGNGGGGGGAVLIVADSGMEVLGDVTAVGGDGGQAQCSSPSANSGGGGGGGGGSLVFVSRMSVTANGRFSAVGGNSGGPCGTGFGGGQGGEGKVRVDGALTGTATFTPVVRFRGPTVNNSSLLQQKLDTIRGTGNAGDSMRVWLMNIASGIRRIVGPFSTVATISNQFAVYVPKDSLRMATVDSLVVVVVAQQTQDLYSNTPTWVFGQASARIINLPHGILAPRDGSPDTILNFGNVNIGQSLTRDLVLENKGTRAITISAIRPVVTLGTNIFTVMLPTLPAHVNAGASITLRVKFSPEDTTHILDSLIFIADDAGASPIYLHVQGNGVQNTSLSRSRLQVDSIKYFVVRSVGDSVMRSVVLRNAGPDTIHIMNFTFTGPQAGDFHFRSTHALMLAPRDSAFERIAFVPTTAQADSAALRIQCDDSIGIHTMRLIGAPIGDSLGTPPKICVAKDAVGDTVFYCCNASGSQISVTGANCIPATAGFTITEYDRTIVNGDCGAFHIHYDHATQAALHVDIAGFASKNIALTNNCSLAIAQQRKIPNNMVFVYPNPCVTQTTIALTRQSSATTTIRSIHILDQLGRVVIAPEDSRLAEGREAIAVAMDNVPAGIYYIRVTTAGSVSTVPLFVVR